ncbi:chemoreceptor glutamine deamidase CheD [Terasakiella sp. A23]|uniref:chemoreceptor glutamine deamidase CheD n=1 Tax=Terasakiella sp. FCG-A23 TaxID=3080561 RepID=UPI00295595B7|nr:chemoreceptor glutamine deamidase CheD [Terasakiella sp. A23]MDV7338695.1 chemoreceptor glutamine deamidase CheD [Terasakiella sp. A23]
MNENTEVSRKYWDPTFKHFAVKVGPGDHYVTKKEDEMLVTTLGSCISACVRDTALGIGGMNHFMLPSSDTGNWSGVSASMRYGNYAMEVLINDILRMGGARNRLEIKVFGGANMFESSMLVGTKNIEFVETYLRIEHMAVSAQHLGGEQGRRIIFFPQTGKVKMKLLDQQDNAAVIAEEQTFKSEIEKTEIEGSIELF